MPYRFGVDTPGFSPELGALVGGLAGLIAFSAELWASGGGGMLGVWVFAAVMAFVYRNVILFLVPLALLIPGFLAFSMAFFLGGVLPFMSIGVVLFLMASLAPAYNHNVKPLAVSVIAGVILAYALAAMLVLFTSVPSDLHTVSDIYRHRNGLAISLYLGFPAFGACYGAGLVLMYEDSRNSGQ